MAKQYYKRINCDGTTTFTYGKFRHSHDRSLARMCGFTPSSRREFRNTRIAESKTAEPISDWAFSNLWAWER